MTNLKLSDLERNKIRGLMARNTAELPNGCLEWTAGKAASYGILWTGVRQLRTHVAVAALTQEVCKGAVVRHLCGNKLCVLPDHLLAGTYKENSADEVKNLVAEYAPKLQLVLQKVREGFSVSGACLYAELPYTTFTRRLIREARS